MLFKMVSGKQVRLYSHGGSLFAEKDGKTFKVTYIAFDGDNLTVFGLREMMSCMPKKEEQRIISGTLAGVYSDTKD